MPTVSTHVLDSAGGGAMVGVAVELRDGSGVLVAGAVTGPDGRVAALGSAVSPGRYRLSWATEGGFVEEVAVSLHLREERHYHVPLLASGASAVTYLGV